MAGRFGDFASNRVNNTNKPYGLDIRTFGVKAFVSFFDKASHFLHDRLTGVIIRDVVENDIKPGAISERLHG